MRDKMNKDREQRPPIHVKLTYELLIGLLQGKRLTLMADEYHIEVIPPFDGVFLTHDELNELKRNGEWNMIQ